GSAHRAHASTEAVAHLLKPAVAGFLMEKELTYLGQLLSNPKHPFVAVLGGAKISGKIDVIRSLLPRVDELLIGGAMACTFFGAMGLEVGASLVEPDRIALAKELLATSGKKLILPRGAVIAPSIERASEHRSVPNDAIPKGWAVFDIDETTQHDFRARLLRAKTIFWNGPMGVFETPPIDPGTRAIATALVEAGKKRAVTLETVAQGIAGHRNVHAGAQDIYWEAKGAFTGATSGPLAKQAGARLTLIGHSERRHVFGETDEQTGKKVTAALAADLQPVL